MEQRELNEWFYDFRKALAENTSCLVRIDERLKNFIERVEDHEKELDDVKKHVQTVRVASQFLMACVGILTSAAAVALYQFIASAKS